MTSIALVPRDEIYILFNEWGISREAKRMTEESVIHLGEPISQVRRTAEDRVWEIYQNYAQSDWDGYGANPVTLNTVCESIRFLIALPFWIPTPQIDPLSSGEIGFEWYLKKNFSFVLAISEEHILCYTGLFGQANSTCGTEYFYDSVPPKIVDFLRRLLREENQKGNC